MADEYIYKEAFQKALDELKKVGIIKNNYSANRVNLWQSQQTYHNGERELNYGCCRAYCFANPNVMPFVPDEMKKLLKYYHTTNTPFNITVIIPNDYNKVNKEIIYYNYYSYRFHHNNYADRPIYVDYHFDSRRFDRSDVHLKVMPAIFEGYNASRYKTFTNVEDVKREIDKDLASYNKFMEVAKPYYTGTQYDDLMKLRKQKESEVSVAQHALWDKERELNQVKRDIEALDGKIKTEFTKKMAIEEDFNG